MAKKVLKSKVAKRNDPKSTKINKPLLKSKLNQRSKHTKAQIEKLNQDMTNIADIHSELTQTAEAKKEVNALDAGSLREDLKRDEIVQKESMKAEQDLTNQLEIITGISL